MSSYTHPPSMTQLPYYRQVLCGMAYIDSHLPGQRWHDDIELDTLNMNYTSDDVLSRTLGYAHTRKYSMSQALGFYAGPDPDLDVRHVNLTETWRAMLRLRNELPTLPEGHVFLGVGNERNTVRHDGVRHCFGWNIDNGSPESPSWDREWSGRSDSELSRNNVAYCAEREHPLAQALLILDDTPQPQPEEKTMEDDGYRAEVKIEGDGNIICYGYNFSHNDAQQLEDFLNYSSSLDDAGFDMEIAAITIGCRRFEVKEITGLLAAYYDKKRERDNPFPVTTGTRLVRGGSTYIVAQIGDNDYLLVSLKTGNRHNSVIVRNPEDRYNIPLTSFLSEGDALTNWSKAS